jgi:hypothetical protein
MWETQLHQNVQPKMMHLLHEQHTYKVLEHVQQKTLLLKQVAKREAT